MVLESLDRLIGAYEGRKESLVVEGVHLSLNSVVRLMQRHPSILPFLIHISNEAKHRERFAVPPLDHILPALLSHPSSGAAIIRSHHWYICIPILCLAYCILATARSIRQDH